MKLQHLHYIHSTCSWISIQPCDLHFQICVHHNLHSQSEIRAHLRGCKSSKIEEETRQAGKDIIRAQVFHDAMQRALLLPTWLFVPTSSVMGRHWWGLMPARAVYRASLPTGMPIPHAPKSPRPRILSPSVTTMARTSGSGLNSSNQQAVTLTPSCHILQIQWGN